METKGSEVRSLFLREFARQLIINYPTTLEEYALSTKQEERIKENLFLTEEAPQRAAPTTTLAEVQNKEYNLSSQGTERRIIFEKENFSLEGPQKIIAIREIDDMQLPPQESALSGGNASFPYQFVQKKQPPKQTAPLPQKPSWIEQWLSDKTVESVECTGPNQNLIVKKNGTITQSTTQLSQEEVKKIVEELSSRAKKPIEEGILKAETSTWSIIGVLSEFGGSRFLLQKKKQ